MLLIASNGDQHFLGAHLHFSLDKSELLNFILEAEIYMLCCCGEILHTVATEKSTKTQRNKI